jgi:hypothetical protein
MYLQHNTNLDILILTKHAQKVLNTFVVILQHLHIIAILEVTCCTFII